MKEKLLDAAREEMIFREEQMHTAPPGTDEYACFVAGILADRYDEARQNYLMRIRECREKR